MKMKMMRMGLLMVLIAVLAAACGPAAALNPTPDLDQIRTDVRQADPPSRAPSPPRPAAPKREHHHHHHHHHHDYDDDCDDDDSELTMLALGIVGLGLTSPWWGPVALLNDDYSRPGYFQSYPYQNGFGRMEFSPYEPAHRRWWSARINAEWGGEAFLRYLSRSFVR